MAFIRALLAFLAVISVAKGQSKDSRQPRPLPKSRSSGHGSGGYGMTADVSNDSYGSPGGNTSVCDEYALLIYGMNTAESQQSLMTVFVNTAMIGNYTTPNVGVCVPGVIWPPFNMPFFNGQLKSSNLAQDIGHGVAINWLDGGGPAAMRQNLSAFNTDSNQFYFITHLHQYFAYLLGCSQYGNTSNRYNGSTNMYHVHKYMALGNQQEQYTNKQFVLSAASLGFSLGAQSFINEQLQFLFSKRCSPPRSIPDWAPPSLQSICTEPECPISPDNPLCSAYDPVMEPMPANDLDVKDP